MSKNNKNQVTEEQISDGTAVDIEDGVEVIEVEAETVEKPNKWLARVKRYAPFVAVGGVIAAAFVFGRHSGEDAAYLALQGLSEGEDGIDETEDDASTDETGDETTED